LGGGFWSGLINEWERNAYRRTMKAAHTLEARQQIRDVTYAQLRQRAWERGILMAEPGARVPGMRGAEGGHKTPAAGGGEGRYLGVHRALPAPCCP